MKKVIHDEIVTTIYKYEAIDGTLFNTEEECLKYESSAKGVLMAKYNRIPKKQIPETELCFGGSDDYLVDVVKIRSKEDLDIILQIYQYEMSSYTYNSECITRALEKIQDSVGGYVFIGRGYELDSFYILDSDKTFINKIKKVYDAID